MRVLRRAHARGVALVAEAEIRRERVAADLRPLGEAALRAHRRVGDEVHLHLGVGRDDRADVASLDDDVAVVAELALALAHHFAHGRMPRDDRHHPVDLRAADRRGDVGAGDEDAAVALEGDRVLAREFAEALAVGEVEGRASARAT